MPTHPLTPVTRRRHLPRATLKEQQSDLLRWLDHLNLTTTEVQLVRLLVRSTPQPVRIADLATAVTGRSDLNRRQRVVLEQQIARLRSKLLAHHLRVLCVDGYGYLLLADSEA